MKIAALADIHGNYQALITVLEHVESWKPDLVIVLGDIINRGPRSRDCLHLIQETVQILCQALHVACNLACLSY